MYYQQLFALVGVKPYRWEKYDDGDREKSLCLLRSAISGYIHEKQNNLSLLNIGFLPQLQHQNREYLKHAQSK